MTRVAIAHDYLTQRGGAERVVLSMARAFPGAPIYTTLYEPDSTYPEFRDLDIRTSPLNRLSDLRKDHRRALPLLPWGIGQMRIHADVVVASSSGWAHGIRTTGRKLVYCHAPARWVYQTKDYLGTHNLWRHPIGAPLMALRPALTRWDRAAASTADRYLANSNVVRERVAEAYGIEADVLFPPFGVDTHGEVEVVPQAAEWADEGFHLIVSRLLPYKHVREAIEAFTDLPERLLVIGAGPQEAELTAMAPHNVRLAGRLTDAQMRWAYHHANVLVAPSYEDFGLTPLEAASFGKPTLALRAGGYLDTIDDSVNGAFFGAATPAAIRAAVIDNRDRLWQPGAITAHAERYSEERFVAELRREVEAMTGPYVPTTG
ncbi:glycosyltransferase [Kribbia dieselivorans]|uniref:glycosyltransferase n=1 Tax=Kribbia dieselivorans TaxID=331526 RepID=UPI0008389920|nr:glycosyltransferase [Kribbia dieselivorans]